MYGRIVLCLAVGVSVGNTVENKIDKISALMELIFWQERLEISKSRYWQCPLTHHLGREYEKTFLRKQLVTLPCSLTLASLSPKQSSTYRNITKARSLRLLMPSKSGVAWSLFSDRASSPFPHPTPFPMNHAASLTACAPWIY